MRAEAGSHDLFMARASIFNLQWQLPPNTVSSNINKSEMQKNDSYAGRRETKVRPLTKPRFFSLLTDTG